MNSRFFYKMANSHNKFSFMLPILVEGVCYNLLRCEVCYQRLLLLCFLWKVYLARGDLLHFLEGISLLDFDL